MSRPSAQHVMREELNVCGLDARKIPTGVIATRLIRALERNGYEITEIITYDDMRAPTWGGVHGGPETT